MGIKIKLKVIVAQDFAPAFARLCQQKFTLPENIRLARAGRIINEALDDFRKAQTAFFETNGTKVDAPGTKEHGSWKLDPEVPGLTERYNKQLDESLAEEIELNSMAAPIKLPEGCTLNALDMVPLLDVIDVSEPPEQTPGPEAKPQKNA
jgi:hypothetical protein